MPRRLTDKVAVKEPVFIQKEDSLPSSHPMAFEEVYCGVCGIMVHCFNNETMCQWVQAASMTLCMDCFQGDRDNATES